MLAKPVLLLVLGLLIPVVAFTASAPTKPPVNEAVLTYEPNTVCTVPVKAGSQVTIDLPTSVFFKSVTTTASKHVHVSVASKDSLVLTLVDTVSIPRVTSILSDGHTVKMELFRADPGQPFYTKVSLDASTPTTEWPGVGCLTKVSD